MNIIDADGHINDHACGEEIAAYMPKGNQLAKLFPEFDHLHFRYLNRIVAPPAILPPTTGASFSTRPASAGPCFYPTGPSRHRPNHGAGLGRARLPGV